MTRIVLLGPANSIHLQRWAAAFVERGHAVCVVSQHRCARDLLPGRADVRWLPHAGTLGYFRNAWALRRILAQWRAELLNVHYASGYGTTATLSGFRPSVLSVWGSDVYDFPLEGAAQGWLVRWNLRRATAVASTSHAMARQVQLLTPKRREVAVTPFGVDLERFAPAPSAATRPGTMLTIGIVKTLAPKYGVDLLLRAIAGLVRDDQLRMTPLSIRLLIVGDGPQRDTLEALAVQLGIGERTEFVGAVRHRDVPHWLQRMDVFVAPSRLDSESFGVAVIEACACALPVVVTSVGGLPEVVLDGQTGLIVPPDDVDALQAALKRLVLDPGLRAALGRRGRSHVEREYGWSHCVDLMQACFAQVLAGAEPP